MDNPAIRRLSLGGIRIDALRQIDLIPLVNHAKSSVDRILVLHHNMHSLYLFHVNMEFRSAYLKATWIYIDGLPLVWMGRFAGLPVTASHRITFLDSFEALLTEAAQLGLRVFYLGSSEEVLSTGITLLRAQHPGLTINGRNGFFDKTEAGSREVISAINAFRADILFVGMGMPIQEIWLAKHYAKIEAHAVLTSGATLDYVTGHAYRPPAWTGRFGLYGILRLLSDPRRLWYRYFIEPIVVLKHLFLPLMRQRLWKHPATDR